MRVIEPSTKVSITDVRGAGASFPEACIPNLIHAIKQNGHAIEWQNLTPRARDYASDLIKASKEGKISKICQILYGDRNY